MHLHACVVRTACTTNDSKVPHITISILSVTLHVNLTYQSPSVPSFTCSRREPFSISGMDFWATVCKTDRPMLSVRCLSVLSVTFVHCGQTVRWIKMKLGTQVGFGPGHIVLDGDPAPPLQKGHSPPPIFGPCVVIKGRHESRCHLVTWYGGRPRFTQLPLP